MFFTFFIILNAKLENPIFFMLQTIGNSNFSTEARSAIVAEINENSYEITRIVYTQGPNVPAIVQISQTLFDKLQKLINQKDYLEDSLIKQQQYYENDVINLLLLKLSKLGLCNPILIKQDIRFESLINKRQTFYNVTFALPRQLFNIIKKKDSIHLITYNHVFEITGQLKKEMKGKSFKISTQKSLKLLGYMGYKKILKS